MSSARPSSTVFRESDYHISPPPRNRRRAQLLERKSTTCMCTGLCVFAVIIIAFCVTIGLRETGNRSSEDFEETLGNTRLLTLIPSLCRAIQLTSLNNAPATLYLLDSEPPLSGWSNISFAPSFVITKYIEYVDNYGWYDYGDLVNSEEINYVAWGFHLNKGSQIKIQACLDNDDASVTNFLLLQDKSEYNNWLDGESFTEYSIPFCSESRLTDLELNHTVMRSNEYYFVFYSPDIDDNEPRINMTLWLNRTEYVVPANNTQVTSCTADGNGHRCSLTVPLHGSKYSLVQTSNKETKDVKFGDKVNLEWVCFSRSWVYVLIFSCPVIFFSCLFITMYCIFAMFWSRKLKKSYQTLDNADNNHITYRIGYEHPDEKRSINLQSSTRSIK